jgi:hypothetical protein
MKYLVLLSLILLVSINTQVVCSEDELIKELLEDINHNGKVIIK